MAEHVRTVASTLSFHLYYNAWRNTGSTWMRERRLAGARRWPRARRRTGAGFDVTTVRIIGAAAGDLTAIRFIAPDDEPDPAGGWSPAAAPIGPGYVNPASRPPGAMPAPHAPARRRSASRSSPYSARRCNRGESGRHRATVPDVFRHVRISSPVELRRSRTYSNGVARLRGERRRARRHSEYTH